MEEKIYQKINEGLGKTALSERTIRSKAARLAAKIKTDEELTEDVLSDAVEDLRVLAGQLDHDVAEKVKIEAERKAAELLKKGGVAWIVANRHLPYEAELDAAFKRVRMVVDQGGYKVFEAVK